MRSRYITGRIGQTIITLLVVLSIMWILFRSMPGDPAAIFIGGELGPEAVESLRKIWGLDEPFYVQYLKYIMNLLRGSFGVSFFYREPVISIIRPCLINTGMIMGPAILMSILMGAVFGSYLGWRRGRKFEKIGTILALFGRSFPLYLSGIIVLMLFAHSLDWFPLGGMRTIGRIGSSWFESFLDVSHHLALPFAVAFLYFVGDVTMISRTSMLEVIGEEFLEFGKAKGLSDSNLRKIAMRNAIIPVLTFSTILMGFAFGGEVLLEMVFSWPGIGRLMVQSVERHDYPICQACFFIMAFVVIISNLIIDLLYGYLDPRIASS